MPQNPESDVTFKPTPSLRRGSAIPLRLAVVAFLLVTMALPLDAQVQPLMRPVNLAFLARRAEVIVQGRVVAARYEGMPNYPNLRTVLVTLDVEHMLRGPSGNRFTFRQYVGPQGRGGAKSGYMPGQRVLLFMPAESAAGLRSPLGFEQGNFRIARGELGQDVIANPLGNIGLFKNVPETAERAGLRLDDAELRLAATPRGAVPLRDFTSLVERLMSLPRNE
jgi:hypothetical protein